MTDGQSKPIVLDGIRFPSQSAAARHYGVVQSTVSRWAFMRYKSRPKQNREPKPVRIDGTPYLSIQEASRRLPISFSTIRKRLHSPRWPNYQFEEPQK